MLSTLGSRNGSLSDDNPKKNCRNALNNSIVSIILSLPWAVAYFVVFSSVNSTTCKDTPYIFAQFAKWAYLVITISEICLFPMRLAVAKKKDNNEESSIETFTRFLSYMQSIFVFAVWIYACVALSSRGSCANSNLVNLIWATVLMPAIMSGVVCCCCCCILLTTAAVLGVAKNSENQQNRVREAAPENELSQSLEEREKSLKMQLNES